MLPANPLVRMCGICTGLILEPRLASGNTFGAVYWTDGKMDAPMLPEMPWLVVCPHCSTPVWIDEQEEVGEICYFDISQDVSGSTYAGAKPCRHAARAVMRKVLKGSGLPLEKRRYLRIRLWWSCNDRRRRTGTAQPMTKDEIENLRELHQILFEGDGEERLMIAELLREMGEFDRALANLDSPFPDVRLESCADQIRELVLQGDTVVRHFSDDPDLYL